MFKGLSPWKVKEELDCDITTFIHPENILTDNFVPALNDRTHRKSRILSEKKTNSKKKILNRSLFTVAMNFKN